MPCLNTDTCGKINSCALVRRGNNESNSNQPAIMFRIHPKAHDTTSRQSVIIGLHERDIEHLR